MHRRSLFSGLLLALGLSFSAASQAQIVAAPDAPGGLPNNNRDTSVQTQQDVCAMNFLSAEDAYQAIASDLLAFVSTQKWDSAKSDWEVWNKSTGVEWASFSGGQKSTGGSFPGREITSCASAAVRYLRDDILETTGQRIWGLTFTLYPTGKFRIAYNYNVPENYDPDQKDPEITLEDVMRLKNMVEQGGGNATVTEHRPGKE
ncbi:MAG: hypothetical protein LBL69_05825 [Zoogloeaceae bacterium]|jgi:hypothetical protein|nr:hypothetical protein [Zoogloeaceae bacterium]